MAYDVKRMIKLPDYSSLFILNISKNKGPKPKTPTQNCTNTQISSPHSKPNPKTKYANKWPKPNPLILSPTPTTSGRSPTYTSFPFYRLQVAEAMAAPPQC